MNTRIVRTHHLDRLEDLLTRFPVVALVGARQVGKTTLARQLVDRWDGEVHLFDLEDPVDQRRLEDPGLALRSLGGLVVLDEVQRMPEVFPLLRVLADREGIPARFLLLGSASPTLTRGASESLAGRVATHHLAGFSMDELEDGDLDQLWCRGGFPRSLLAETDEVSAEWRREFLTTFVERDLPQLALRLPSATARRFWTMLAHVHGQVLNSSALGRSMGIADTTVRRYVDALVGTYMVRQLPPWHANLRKRQVRSPKLYLADSGLLHSLLGLEDGEAVTGHPISGFSWEGFALDQVVRHLGARPDECYFWATHAGAELDLLVVRGNRRLGFEFKRAEAPASTRSMHTALKDLDLESLTVIHAGEQTYDLAPAIRAVPLGRLGPGEGTERR